MVILTTGSPAECGTAGRIRSRNAGKYSQSCGNACRLCDFVLAGSDFRDLEELARVSKPS
jgi:hypothetical protein